METISIKFVDFWPSFDHLNNKFVNALKAKRNVVILPENSDEEPDLLFYSRCGLGKHYNYKKSIKIFYTGENDYPNFNECDFSISFHDIDVAGRNLRYPLYALETNSDYNIKRNEMSDAELLKRDFCSFVMSNSTNCDPFRIAIVDALSAYKPIAYGGAFRNNVGGRVKDKQEFISNYKFNLALENSKLDGYVTEKIAESFQSRTIPIYWGGNMVCKDFNPESFINVDDYYTLDSLLNAVVSIDSDPKLYLKILNTPSKLSDTIVDFDERLGVFLNRIADSPRQFRSDYGEIGLFQHRYSIVHPLSQRNIYLKFSKIIGHILQPEYFKNKK